MSVCMRYEKDDDSAKDLLNQGFLKVLTNLKKYKDDVPFEPWIKRIMINVVIDNYRKNTKYKEQIWTEENEKLEYLSNDSVNNYADEQFSAEDLEQMIRSLPEASQKIFNLYAIDGYNHKEIADMLNISDGTSKWHLSFARKKLKEMIKESLRTLSSMIV